MASFRLRGLRWQARILRKGSAPVVQSFVTRLDAERWARSVETDMDKGSFVSVSLAQRTTLGEVISRYIAEVRPSMRGAKDDAIRLNAIKRHGMCRLALTALTPAVLGQYRDERLHCVSAGTVIRELAYLSSIINHARREWGVQFDNPVARVRKPSSPQGRSRTLSPQECTALLNAVQPTGRRGPWLMPIVTLALATAMRRSEILSLRWKNIDMEKRIARLDTTKNGERRIVPLSSRAIAVLDALPRHITGVVFPLTGFAFAAAFNRAVIRSGILDFRFHDLRHCAITAMAEKLPNLVELSSVTGHKSLKMLQRYYHPNPVELAAKLG